MVKTLNRKVLREISGMKSQTVTIALVVAAGVALFVGSKSAYDSLSRAREHFYGSTGFAEGFVSLKKAPRSTATRIAATDGVAVVEARITQQAALDFPGERLPSAGRFISVPEKLSRLAVRSGKLPEANNEVMLSEAFALANKLIPGSRIVAILNGKRQVLKVTGTALSPEFVYIFRPASFMPDDKHYGILWLTREAMENYFDFGGAFNDLAITFSPGANTRHTLKLIDNVLEPYGGLGAYDRNKLASYAFLRDEFRQLRTNIYFLPLIFLGVAAFLLHIVATRLIARQREQIASLMALGYSNREIVQHYLKLMLVISGGGALLGVGIGWWLGSSMTSLYGAFYRFPDLRHVFHVSVVLSGLAIGASAGVFGTWFSVKRVMKMQPAQAMRPPVPESFAQSFLESYLRNIPAITRMFIRNLLRRPWRTVLSILGLSTAVMIMVLGMFMNDVMDLMLGTQFELLNRESLTVSFLRPVSANVLDDLASRRGVQLAEGYRQVPVRLRHGQFTKELAITGLPDDAQLRRVADKNSQIVALPPEGVLLNTNIAKKMGLKPGDTIELELLEGNRRKVRVTIANLVEEILGQGCYMRIAALNHLLGEEHSITTAALRIDPHEQDALIAHLKKSSAIASIDTREGTLKIFYEMMSRSMLAMITIVIIFASAISIGVVYNTAMILLSERTFELGSLRILGFTKVEVFEMIASELGTTVLASILPGCVFGYFFAWLLMNTVDTEEFTIKLMITNRTYVTAILMSLGTAVISFVILFFRIRKMDLVSVLKVRE
ncbi:MAG: ABC transporter permease [Spirochaetota bacterium]